MMPEDLVTSVAETDAYIDRITELEQQRDDLRNELATARDGETYFYRLYEEQQAISTDLLEACEAAEATWNDNAPGPGLTERQAIAKLQAAIAKARGDAR